MVCPSSPRARPDRPPLLALAAAAPLAALLLAAAGCDAEGEEAPLEALAFEPADAEHAPDPGAMGPFPVGVRTVTLVYDRRTTTFPEPRTLHVEIWYPAAQSAKGEPGVDYDLWTYLPEHQQEIIPRDALGVLETPAVRDAEPQPDRGPFPLVVFSHGKGGVRQQSTFYTVQLASHGYIVVSPDHEGDTLVEQIDAGDIDPVSTIESFADRPVDVQILINHFTEGDDPIVPFVDPERVGVTGHSFGALTSFRTAAEDARVDVIVPQTPPGVGLVDIGSPVTTSELGIPILMMSAHLDRTLPYDPSATSLWENMRPVKGHFSLRTGGHFTYSDLCILDLPAIQAAMPDINIENVLGDGCGEENLPPDVALPAINHFAIGFFNRWLRGSEGTDAFLNEDLATELTGGDAEFALEQ